MKKNVLIISVIMSIVTLSCATAPSLPSVDTGVDRLTDIPEMNPAYFKVKGDPEMVDILNNAFSAMLSQEWDTAVEWLDKGIEYSGPEGDKVLLSLLAPMKFSSVSGLDALDILIREFPDNREFVVLNELHQTSPMSFSWRDDPVSLSWLEPSTAKQATENWPLVEVAVNGKVLRMVPDTGAMITVVFSDSARKAGIEISRDHSVVFGSSNRKNTNGAYGVIPRMSLGGLDIDNALTGFVDRPFLFPKHVDGLIGWPVLSRLVMELDKREGTITFRSSCDEGPGVRNFFWVSDPAVFLIGGIPRKRLLFFLDTGAASSHFNDAGLEAVKGTTVKYRKSWTMGIGGFERQTSAVVNVDFVFLDGFPLSYREYLNRPIKIPVLPGAYGVLGSDVARAGTLRFNFPAGRISFEPYETFE
ncbi:MAG: retropepsin-like domain-containing protein [Spirochaetales bacterium]|nr:retropepsin-like domain-containing protein [Spirochaetales bacterium]